MLEWEGERWLPEAADAVRVLSAEMITAAGSGHPGLPLGMAEVATVLWCYFLRHNPLNPDWVNRDRFVLSNGHGSAMLYALLHLSGYSLTVDDLRRFRQLNTKTPGHPEYGVTCGVEVTTGPLGQGVANAVGLALAERTLAASFNRPNFQIMDHFTYLFVGDGCLMEGVAYEAISLAGTQRLDKLIMFWDNNGISIDGEIEGWFDEDVAGRFRALHWRVLEVDGHNPEEIYRAIFTARNCRVGQPTLIACSTIIGRGTDYAGSCRIHGSPLGIDELAKLKMELDWHYPDWSVPRSVYDFWSARCGGSQLEREWHERFSAYADQYPQLATELIRRLHGRLPDDWYRVTEQLVTEAGDWSSSEATRQFSWMVLEHYQASLPELLGGSADLTSSNLTHTTSSLDITGANPAGNYLHYGVREFAMMAIMNGLALHGGFIPYAGTFLVFVEYGLAAVRMAAIMRLRVIYVLTHDSIGVGEDGPTHQPIEQTVMLRSIPNLEVWRPASGLETAVAWQTAITRSVGPTALLLSRQSIPYIDGLNVGVEQIARGGYVLWRGVSESVSEEIVVIATGSEVEPAYRAARILVEQHRLTVRVVSMPSMERFEQQEECYKQAVLPPALMRRVAVEAGSPISWYRYVTYPYGLIIGLEDFGLSAPAKQLFTYFGFTAEKIAQSILKWL